MWTASTVTGAWSVRARRAARTVVSSSKCRPDYRGYPTRCTANDRTMRHSHHAMNAATSHAITAPHIGNRKRPAGRVPINGHLPGTGQAVGDVSGIRSRLRRTARPWHQGNGIRRVERCEVELLDQHGQARAVRFKVVTAHLDLP